MTKGLTDEAIAAYAAQLLDLEADIEALQGDKKDVYANLRDAYGKRAADSLKLAIKRHRMDADKRDEADEIDAEAERFLAVIRAPRATRVEIIEEFDPETGEITEPQAKPATSGETAANAVTTGGSPIEGMPAKGGDDVANRLAHVPEKPGHEISSVSAPAEGGTNSATISEPETAAPLPQEPVSEPGDRRAEASPAATVVPNNVTILQTKKRWTFSDPPHPHCLNPHGPTGCGGFSNMALCTKCKVAAGLVKDGDAA